jgi:hypothetical protein
MKFLDAAQRLLELDWAVFPLSPGSKLPAISKKAGGQGVLDASKSLDQIREWARRFPHANVGIACGAVSGLTVVDLDPKAGSNDTVRQMKALGRIFKPTVSARTPSGGWHLYYGYVPQVLNSKSLLGKGIDIRTTGGYVVAPPSVLDGGRFYRWHLAPLGADIARMPIWASMALKPKENAVFVRKEGIRDANAALSGLAKFVTNAAESQRNSCLYWAACRAAEGGYADEATAEMLAQAAASIGLSRKESLKTIGSAFKARRRFA